MHSEKEGGKVRRADGNKELGCQWIRQRRPLRDEVEKSIQSKDRKGQAQQVASNN